MDNRFSESQDFFAHLVISVDSVYDTTRNESRKLLERAKSRYFFESAFSRSLSAKMSTQREFRPAAPDPTPPPASPKSDDEPMDEGSAQEEHQGSLSASAPSRCAWRLTRYCRRVSATGRTRK